MDCLKGSFLWRGKEAHVDKAKLTQWFVGFNVPSAFENKQ